ncbi:ribonuclease R [Aureibacter tunicatorum]|uniref:Ribonuclease R n=1 Tax=Aureibacter tunicatorum TaxID=866807 RepID=A0AAE3XK19_9BACT|nr:ribonuclease R [Aureibacter tunicatorum]MDR6238337.1 ribonuclease R [Aureibacter tunicatorum]BDD03369.1 ribonuclease R [Aureibacter tunicatorum]
MTKKRLRKHNSKKSARRLDILPKQIIEFLNQNAEQAFSARKLIRKLQIKDRKTKRKATEVLEYLSKTGRIKEVGTSLYMSSQSSETITGTVDYVNPGFAYVICEGLEKDVYVRSEDMMHALDGDQVKITIKRARGRGGRPEGYVTGIVSRKREEFVGHVEISPRFAFVVADNKKMHNDIFIPMHNLKGAKHNDKVIAKMVRWPDRDKNPTGTISKVLGKSGENETEIHAIMAEFELPFEFDPEVEEEANSFSDKISEKEYRKRKDFRGITTFTIDPLDAKDFDDALSIRKLENGNTEVGVHIADVSHYVRPGTRLDEEAFTRATSVYLVDRTIPMLPERLSNGLCSLRPEEEKLAFSAVFELNENAQIVSEWFGRTVIYSDRRFTYEEAQERIETLEGDFAKEIVELNELALKLRVKRFAEGSINFETTEVKFRLDENGKPLEVIPKVRKDAHKLVEDFMLLANKRVAEFVFNKKKGKEKDTFVYRVHDYPDPEKLEDFSKFAKRFGYLIKSDESGVSNSLNTLLDDIEGKPEQNLLETIAIRTMAKAKYSTEEMLHFGLAFKHYSHFTSPIRRYPDLMVHRLLQHYLDGGKSADREEYEEYCKHCSERERVAADADRASIKYKQVEYMESLEKRNWEGIVSGVTEWGIFVEITETHCEGMVRMAEMKDDFYEFDEENFRVIGQSTKRMITLGDKVIVKVIKTDINRRTIDLAFVND